MFEKATRLKLRYQTSRGMLSVEDLWDVPLIARSNGLSLDNIARDLNKQVKESGEESFVVKKSESDATLVLMFNIVKHIIEFKLTEAENNEQSIINIARRKQILKLIADKNEEGLKAKSVDELKEMLKEVPTV